MAEQFKSQNAPSFSSPEEEVAFLRETLKQKENALVEGGQEVKKEEIARETLKEYSEIAPEQVLPKEKILTEPEQEKVVLRLAPEAHDGKMEELLGVLLTKGIKNALSVLQKINDPHLDDDFHRFLIQYIYSTHDALGLKGKNPLFKALHMVLFEVTLPEGAKDDPKGFKEFISAMEQFYAGMQSVTRVSGSFSKNHYSLEIAIANDSDQVIVYAAVPRSREDLFEKQVLAFYHDAHIREVTDDYNIFNPSGSVGAFAELTESEALPIKTYDSFDHDPINTLLSIFSNLKREGEGAAIQFIVSPAKDEFIKKFNTILKDVKEGKPLKKTSEIFSKFDRELAREVKQLIFGANKKKTPEEKEKKIDENLIERITEKIKSTIVKTNIRIVASAGTKNRAQEILLDLESAFNQFTETNSNSIVFRTVSDQKLPELIHKYSYRIPEEEHSLPLNLKELSTLFHFPAGLTGSPQLKQAKAGVAPAPMELAGEGVLLGINNFRGKETPVYMSREDRLRHFYVIGQTGTGKTVVLKNMVMQDINNGEGVCFIDPHGSDIQDILANIPKERYDDVIYFDPAATERPMALNMLEYDQRFPEQKTLVVDELLGIFNRLFDMKAAGGPAFEQYFRNSALLVMEHPESGSTLLEIGRVLSDKTFRDMKLSHSKNPIINQFWKNAEETTGDTSLANFVPYITNKFDVFITNEIMRPIIAQQNSSFNFREIMDEKKILLVNLSKGRLGEINSNLIGLILVGKILMAALSRVDMIGKGTPMNDFYLYIDEFQNVTTDSISQILSEARKYKLSLNIAHQFIAQLDDSIKDAVFGNVGSIAAFRVGADDAQYLESQFAPVFDASDITKLDNYNAYLKLLVNGQPVKPFNIKTLPPTAGDAKISEQLKELSYMKYGRPRAEVEGEIMERYKSQFGDRS
ncbi:hypothetical protein COB64_04145 [Candidatus Wolfebacteria bacterium]|nr:MAG: hypothetical protein COB64_04145 [Candidatus Wolfebacteria bacterium]